MVFEGNSGGGEMYAGIVAILAIGKQLGVETTGRHFDRDKLAPIALRIAGLTDAQLREAAAAAFRELFGEAPTQITDRPQR